MDVYPGDFIMVNASWDVRDGRMWQTVFGHVELVNGSNLLTSWGTTVPLAQRAVRAADMEDGNLFLTWSQEARSDAMRLAEQIISPQAFDRFVRHAAAIGRSMPVRGPCGGIERIDVQGVCVDTSSMEKPMGNVVDDHEVSMLMKLGRYWGKPLAKLPLGRYEIV